jgi:hypothetical protein
MPGCCPKTSKYGGLPNYTYEQRKPVELGIMIRDATEFISGDMVFLGPVQGVEAQHGKDFHGEMSCLPNGSKVSTRIAEVLW